jgi:hypothetical protein
MLELLFTTMGYDTKSDKSIHEQFVERVLQKNGVDLNEKRRLNRSKYKHLNPPQYGTREYYNWYNNNIRRKTE